MEQASYQRLLSRSTNLAPWMRVKFADKNVCCAACAWKPSVFLTKAHARTSLSIHHMVSSADDGSDEPDNLIILCPNCHSTADYLPNMIVMPLGEERRNSLIRHLQLLNNEPEEWKRLRCLADAAKAKC